VTTKTLYWRVRSLVARTPGAVRFFDGATLASLLESAGLTVDDLAVGPGHVTVLARR
jgi:hypothetical protein